MIQGTGIDIVELYRIDQLYAKQEKFSRRVLSEHEWKRFNEFTNHKRKIEFLAGRFAAKEAYSKALGTGIGKHLSFQSIEVKSNEMGQPQIYVNKEFQKKAHLTISHSKEYAIAQVILEK